MTPLASIQPGHPCLWGEVGLEPRRPLLVEHGAYLLPTRRTGEDGPWWVSRRQGAISSDGHVIWDLTDLRGHRPVYPLPPNVEDVYDKTDGEQRSLVLYGGTLFEHFGHLLLDLTRLYRLLTLFRRSRQPIWFHYPALQGGKPIENPLVADWLDCLGIRKRVRILRYTLQCEELVSSPVLYRDRSFVSKDFPRVAQRALVRGLRRRLLQIQPQGAAIAYLSRHRLQTGTTCFAGEQEVVAALRQLSTVDVIHPEELSIEDKLGLYRRYRLVTGFVQAAMLLKYFVPSRHPGDVARQVMLVAGPHSLNSNWVNLERAYNFGDHVIDCSLPAGEDGGADLGELGGPTPSAGFQRQHRFNVGLVIDQLRALADR